MNNNKLGYLFLLTIPLFMALSSVAGISIGNIRHTGLYWMFTFVAGLIILPMRRGKITFPIWAWLPFYAYAAISLFWTRMDLRDNIQLYTQMCVFPIVGMIASYTVTTVEEVNRFRPIYVAATILIGLFCVYYTMGPGKVFQYTGGSLYQGFAERPAAVSLIVVAAMFISTIHVERWLSLSVWGLCIAISILSGSRMATFVLVAMWLVHPNFGNLKTRALAIGAMMVFGLAAFNTKIIQDRFFNRKTGFSGSGTISDVLAGKFDSAGRFDSWPIIYEKAFESFWFGHGIGESAPFVFRVWAPMDKPHNEYLRMFFEGGILGLATFVFGLVGTLVNLVYILRKTKKWNWPCVAAYISWVGLLLMAIVDNPLVYGNNFVHIVFFLVGSANGIFARWQSEQDRNAETEVAQTSLQYHSSDATTGEWDTPKPLPLESHSSIQAEDSYQSDASYGNADSDTEDDSGEYSSPSELVPSAGDSPDSTSEDDSESISPYRIMLR